jgi:hypothetical protein
MLLDFELPDESELRGIPAEWVRPVLPFGDVMIVRGDWFGSVGAVRSTFDLEL